MTASASDERLRLAAEMLARYRFEPWKYGDSIGFEGLLAASDLLSDDRWEGWVHGALKGWAGRTHRAFREMDNTMPGHALCLAYERTGDDALIEAAAELVDFLRTRGTVDGVFVSWEHAPLRPPHGGNPLSAPEAALLRDAGPGIFVDCLHFDPPFFGHLGRLVEDVALVDVAVEQARGYISSAAGRERDLLALLPRADGATATATAGAAAKAGRCWGFSTCSTTCPTATPGRRSCRSRRSRSRKRSSGCSETTAAGQRSSATQPRATSPPRPPSPLRASPTASRLDSSATSSPSPRDRAWQHTITRVDRCGVLADVSAAVWPCTDQSHYSHAPTGFIVPWGQGPLLVAAERMRSLGLGEI